MLTGVTPCPSQRTDIRSNSVSKHAQQSFPGFRISPRGVRLFVGQPSPNSRASRTEEKNGKSGSTNSAPSADPGLASTTPAGALVFIETTSKINNNAASRAHDPSWSSSLRACLKKPARRLVLVVVLLLVLDFIRVFEDENEEDGTFWCFSHRLFSLPAEPCVAWEQAKA